MDGLQEPKRYPRLARRIRAVIVDGIILSVVFFATAVPVSSTAIPTYMKIGIVALLPLILEPGLVSFSGATIGHRLLGLRVERADNGRNLDPVRATLRFMAKFILGWLSLVFILLTRRRQALHDLAAGSVVILADPSKAADGEGLTEQTIEEAGYVYPVKPKRIVFILLYAFGSLFLYGIASLMFGSDTCAAYYRCNAVDTVLALAWLASLVAIAALGWRGRLWGCRRTPHRRP